MSQVWAFSTESLGLLMPLAALPTGACCGLLLAGSGLLALGLYLLLPPGRKWSSPVGGILVAVGLGLCASLAPGWEHWLQQGIFWGLGSATVAAAVATITSRNPIYSALWFSVVLLLVAALMMSQGAYFLGVATVVVYAGAIVVVFLFVLMMAQPAGLAVYDRMSWGKGPAAVATFAAIGVAALVISGLLSYQGSLRDQVAQQIEALVDEQGNSLLPMHGATVAAVTAQIETSEVVTLTIYLTSEEPASLEESPYQLNAEQQSLLQEKLTSTLFEAEHRPSLIIHMLPAEAIPERRASSPSYASSAPVATLGGTLFSRHLISVDAIGVLLLAALVAALAIVSRGEQAVQANRGDAP